MNLRLHSVVWRRPGFTLRVDAGIEGHLCGLCGPSGAGKTTLLEIIAGLRRPDQGRVVLDGQVLSDASDGTWVPPEQRGVGYVPQDLALFPHLDVRGNLYFGHRPDGAASALAPGRVIDVLEIGRLLGRPIDQLSGGEKQRVALGRALLASPRLLLLDEPMTGLDDTLKHRALACVRAVVEELLVPVIYISHSQAELDALGAPRFLLRDGAWVSGDGDGDG